MTVPPPVLYAFSPVTSLLLHSQASLCRRPVPDVRPGYTVRVYERIREGDRDRTQPFEGVVLAVHKGKTPADATFTVRRIASGVGVEKVFPFHSPLVTKIEVKKVAKVRRAKLFFLRGRRGKAARLSARFTTAEEFAIATVPPFSAEGKVEEEKEEAVVEEAEEEKKEV